MSPDEIAAERIETLTLTQRASVFLRIPTGQPNAGRYDPTPVRTGLKCRLKPSNQQPAQTSQARAELASTAELAWERGYDMPEGAQVSVDAYPGYRYQVQERTQWRRNGPGGSAVARYCMVRRVAEPT